MHRSRKEASAVRHSSPRHTLRKDVPLHDSNGRVATQAICPYAHKTPLVPGWPSVQNSPAFLKKFLRINGFQMFWVSRHQILGVLSGCTAVECLGESTVESTRAVSHGTHCGKEADTEKAVSVHCG